MAVKTEAAPGIFKHHQQQQKGEELVLRQKGPKKVVTFHASVDVQNAAQKGKNGVKDTINALHHTAQCALLQRQHEKRRDEFNFGIQQYHLQGVVHETASAPASFAKRLYPAVASSVPPATAAASSELKMAELRSQKVLPNLSGPKTNAASSAKFKQVDEPTAVDCLSKDSLTAALSHNINNGSAHMSATVLPPQMRNGPDNGVIKMQQYQQQNGATMGGGCGGAEGLISMMPKIFKEIRRAILVDVRYKPHEATAAASDEDSASLSQLRLSSLSRKSLTEEKREEKVAKLSPELRDRVNLKLRQLELSYRSDCETYGLVANKLIAKDRLLEDNLKFELQETLVELEADIMRQLNNFLDQISFV